MNEYSFEVKLRAFVRVRASDKNEASKVAELVLGAPSSLEIGLANENIKKKIILYCTGGMAKLIGKNCASYFSSSFRLQKSLFA